jgi:hypothetical protein
MSAGVIVLAIGLSAIPVLIISVLCCWNIIFPIIDESCFTSQTDSQLSDDCGSRSESQSSDDCDFTPQTESHNESYPMSHQPYDESYCMTQIQPFDQSYSNDLMPIYRAI